ncbi:MAG: STAS/SEC14 domain-containing protein [Solirubrobacterales bacterium]|nr:STAS/SEC14 domain-containing protein [Solirubrobacterales bacterium]
MIERLEDVPEDVLGFRASGKITREDYREVLIPPLREAAESGDKIRMLFQLGPGLDGYEPGGLVEDAKAEFQLGLGERSAWNRIALVTDVGWARRGLEFFAWMVPGESKAFGLDELGEARDWVAG